MAGEGEVTDGADKKWVVCQARDNPRCVLVLEGSNNCQKGSRLRVYGPDGTPVIMLVHHIDDCEMGAKLVQKVFLEPYRFVDSLATAASTSGINTIEPADAGEEYLPHEQVAMAVTILQQMPGFVDANLYVYLYRAVFGDELAKNPVLLDQKKVDWIRARVDHFFPPSASSESKSSRHHRFQSYLGLEQERRRSVMTGSEAHLLENACIKYEPPMQPPGLITPSSSPDSESISSGVDGNLPKRSLNHNSPPESRTGNLQNDIAQTNNDLPLPPKKKTKMTTVRNRQSSSGDPEIQLTFHKVPPATPQTASQPATPPAKAADADLLIPKEEPEEGPEEGSVCSSISILLDESIDRQQQQQQNPADAQSAVINERRWPDTVETNENRPPERDQNVNAHAVPPMDYHSRGERYTCNIAKCTKCLEDRMSFAIGMATMKKEEENGLVEESEEDEDDYGEGEDPIGPLVHIPLPTGPAPPPAGSSSTITAANTPGNHADRNVAEPREQAGESNEVSSEVRRRLRVRF